MKLGELRAAIRKHKGGVLARAELGGVVVDIPVQKTSFITMLDAFGENKATESGLIFTDDGVVTTKELVDAQLDVEPIQTDGPDLDMDLGLDLDLGLSEIAPDPVEGGIDLDMDLLG